MKTHALYRTAVIWLTVLAVLGLCAAVAHGQIEVKPQYSDHEPIVVTVSVPGMPEGAVLRKAKFKCPGASVVKVDEATFHVWAAPGAYAIEATGTWRLYQTIIDKADKEWKVIADEDDYEFAASFTVGEVPPVPPPIPPVPPGARKAVILEETEQKTPAQGILWDQLRKVYPVGKLEILDDDLPSAQKYLPLVKLPTRPVLLVLTDSGALVREVSCPASVAEVQREVNR